VLTAAGNLRWRRVAASDTRQLDPLVPEAPLKVLRVRHWFSYHGRRVHCRRPKYKR